MKLPSYTTRFKYAVIILENIDFFDTFKLNEKKIMYSFSSRITSAGICTVKSTFLIRHHTFIGRNLHLQQGHSCTLIMYIVTQLSMSHENMFTHFLTFNIMALSILFKYVPKPKLSDCNGHFQAALYS